MPESPDSFNEPQARARNDHAGAGILVTAAMRPEPAPREIGGPAGPEPTRYGDWEKSGRCIDF